MKKTIAILLAAVLALCLAACGETTLPLTEEHDPDPTVASGMRYIMVDGELYYDTDLVIDELRCGVMDGEITASVAETEQPRQNDCSNFGSGCGYQYAGLYSIDVMIDGKWCRFQRELPGCSYAEETTQLPQAENRKTEGFLCVGEEKAPDVETAIRLALRECEDGEATDAAYDAADGGIWRIRLTRDGEAVTVWINTDGITKLIIYGE